MYPSLSIAASAALLAASAPAQETPSPGGVPIYDITPQAVPTPAPTPVPSPRPTAVPTPRAIATPRATPAVRDTPSPRATATPRAVPTPTPTPRPTAAVPVVVPTADPAPQPTAATVPVPVATSDALPSPVAQDTPAPADSAMPWWLWFLAGIVVAALGAVLLGRLRRGRGREAAREVAPPVPVAPVSSPVVPPAPAPAPAPAAPVVSSAPPAVAAAPTQVLEFQLAPLRVGIEGDNALLDFDLTVGNPTSTGVDEVRIATLLLTANARQDEQLAAFFANTGPRGLDPFALPAGQRRHLEATMALPRDAVNVVTSRERPFFVPLMAIDARYRWADGRESRTTAAFVVGPTLPSGKLAPIFLDKGDRMIDRLEARLHGEVRRT